MVYLHSLKMGEANKTSSIENRHMSWGNPALSQFLIILASL
jgi:hypothetical protein